MPRRLSRISSRNGTQPRVWHPGLRERKAFLDKTQYELEDRITQRLQAIGEMSSAALISELFHGEGRLWSWSHDDYDPLRLISSARVKAVADLLGRLDGGSLFDEEEQEWLGEDYRELSRLCLEAAERGEAVIVGLSCLSIPTVLDLVALPNSRSPVPRPAIVPRPTVRARL